jgi:hypothetical protein
METIALDMRFHPVGQGLFTSGHIRSFDGSTNFNWVYDCGTSSSQTLVSTSILRLESDVASDCLDLVIISHFDHDHISGLVKLLSKFKIKTLLLPYMPLWQRLHSAFVEGVDTQDALMGLFIDPVAYVLALEGGDKIEQVVLVPSSTESPGGDEDGEAPIEGGVVPVTFEFGDPPTDAGELAPHATKQKWLKPNGKIQLNGVWEFVPYNDAKFQPSNVAKFRKKVDTVLTNLLKQPDNAERNLALKELKSIYDGEFGKSAFKRNVISLFLYGGPIGKGHLIIGPCQSTCFARIAHPFFWEEVWHWQEQMNGRRVGFLMTGDGYLDTPE